MTDREQRKAARAEQARKYNHYRQLAAQTRERAMTASTESDRRRLMTQSDDWNARAYHEVA